MNTGTYNCPKCNSVMVPNDGYEEGSKKPMYQCPNCKFKKVKGKWEESKFPTGLWKDDTDKIRKEKEKEKEKQTDNSPVIIIKDPVRFHALNLAMQYLVLTKEENVTVERVKQLADEFVKQLAEDDFKKNGEGSPNPNSERPDKISDIQIKEILEEFKRLDKNNNWTTHYVTNKAERIGYINKLVQKHNLPHLSDKDLIDFTPGEAQDLLFWIGLE